MHVSILQSLLLCSQRSQLVLVVQDLLPQIFICTIDFLELLLNQQTVICHEYLLVDKVTPRRSIQLIVEEHLIAVCWVVALLQLPMLCHQGKASFQILDLRLDGISQLERVIIPSLLLQVGVVSCLICNSLKRHRLLPWLVHLLILLFLLLFDLLRV